MGDANTIRTLVDYSKPSHEGYRNTIELPVRNNVVPLRSDTILLVQNRCSFHELRYEDPNQHLKDFLKLVDSLDLDGKNRERTRLCLFQFFLRDQASNWLERLPVGSITTWEDLTTRFIAQFFPPGRTTKLRNDILMFQQHQGESISDAWTHFKDLLQKVPHHGIELWLQYCMEDPKQAFVEYASSRTDEARSKWCTFKPEKNNLGDTYNPSWKSHLNLRKRILATANAVIDCRMANIAVGKGITRSVIDLKGVNLGEEEAPYWTTLRKRESYKPRPSLDRVGTQIPYYARKDFLDYHLPKEWEFARDTEINPFKDFLVFRWNF
uniref:Zinc finger, CCHC-type n=1 Tax=Tanacetum cinerariifolium TaxID=118510 RepID=A0A699HG82_TANCI|nr:zinc finger, CCHC-type [Tanacetum cinerariifolium]